MTDQRVLAASTRSDWTGRLLSWYRIHRRPLPWRADPDPYRVWIAEIMGQQTRMDVLVPYYERFVDRLPTVADLSAVDDEILFKLWEGLGYYRRAVNLKRAAGIVVERHGGILPANAADLRALPGIGDYTAGAILSIAFGVFEPAVDGNVRRVIARAFGVGLPPGSAAGAAAIDRLVRDHAPAEAPGDYTQALMELGALVCLPNGAPRCGDCPVRDDCVARIEDRTAALPHRPEKKRRRTEDWTVVVCLSATGNILLEKRPEDGLLAGMRGPATYPGSLSADTVSNRLETSGRAVVSLRPLAARTHAFTHVEWRMTGYVAVLADLGPASRENVFDVASIAAGVAIPSAFRGFVDEAVKPSAPSVDD